MKRPDGRKYSGFWKDGQQDGKGVMILGNGIKIEGEWKNGQKFR